MQQEEVILFFLSDLQNHKHKMVDLYGIIPRVSNYILEKRNQEYESVIIYHCPKFVRCQTKLGDHLCLREVAGEDRLGFEIGVGQMLYDRLNK